MSPEGRNKKWGRNIVILFDHMVSINIGLKKLFVGNENQESIKLGVPPLPTKQTIAADPDNSSTSPVVNKGEPTETNSLAATNNLSSYNPFSYLTKNASAQTAQNNVVGPGAQTDQNNVVSSSAQPNVVGPTVNPEVVSSSAQPNVVKPSEDYNNTNIVSKISEYIDEINKLISSNMGFSEFLNIKMTQEKLIQFNDNEYLSQLNIYKKNLSNKDNDFKKMITEITTEYETIKAFYKEWNQQKPSDEETTKIISLLTKAKQINSTNTFEDKVKKDNQTYAGKIIDGLLSKQSKLTTVGRIICSLERASTLLQNEIDASPQQTQNTGQKADSFLLRFVGDEAFVSTFYLGKQKDGKTSVQLTWPLGKTERTTNFYYFFTTNASGFDNSQSKSIVYDGNELIKLSDNSEISITGFINGLFKESIALREPVQYNISEYNNTFLFDRSYSNELNK
jgi:hypothetical protein